MSPTGVLHSAEHREAQVSASGSARRLPWKPIAVVIAVIAALGIGALAGSNWGERDAAPAPTPTASETAAGGQEAPEASATPSENPFEPLFRRQDGDPFALGAVDAPVVIIEYADFTCRYCGVFAVETLPTLLEEYVEAGLVRFEWWDAPILSDDSVQTAIAARAAAEQDLFWEFYDEIFAHTYDGGDYERDDILALAAQVDGLDLAAFETALDDPALAQAVALEGQQSQQLGVQSTPTFVVGSQVLSGAQPAEVFRQVIDEQLAAA